MNYVFRFIVVLPLCLTVGLSNQSLAQPNHDNSEYKIKAAFMYKFGSYVEWPEEAFADPNSPFTIGVIGADSLVDDLQEIITGRTVNGRHVEVRKLSPDNSFAYVHMLFIGRGENSKLATILSEAQQFPVLTVTESEEFLQQGGIINFIISEDRVRFDISLSTAGRNNLKISARLLQVARKVIAESS